MGIILHSLLIITDVEFTCHQNTTYNPSEINKHECCQSLFMTKSVLQFCLGKRMYWLFVSLH